MIIQQGHTALGIMIVSTIAVLIDPARMAEVDAVLMMMYGSLSALVGAYFCFSGVAAKKGLISRGFVHPHHSCTFSCDCTKINFFVNI